MQNFQGPVTPSPRPLERMPPRRPILYYGYPDSYSAPLVIPATRVKASDSETGRKVGLKTSPSGPVASMVGNLRLVPNNRDFLVVGLPPQLLEPKLFRFPNADYIVLVPLAAGDYTVVGDAQIFWSLHNLPDILYIVHPPAEHTRTELPLQKTRNKVYGKHINDFTVLPIRISSMVEGWRLEAWQRLDWRITAEDIIDRVDPRYRASITPDTIYQRRREFRELFQVSCWEQRSEDTIVWFNLMLEAAGIDPRLNSTRGLTPGLIDPTLGEAGGRIPLPPNFNPPVAPTAYMYRQVFPNQLAGFTCPVDGGFWVVDARGAWTYYPAHNQTLNRPQTPDPVVPFQIFIIRLSQNYHVPQFPVVACPTALVSQPRPIPPCPRNIPVSPLQAIPHATQNAPAPKSRVRAPRTPRCRTGVSGNIASTQNGDAITEREVSNPYHLPRVPSADQNELAYHGGPPVREFDTIPEEPRGIMPLEDYLVAAHITYEVYIRSRYEEELDSGTTPSQSDVMDTDDIVYLPIRGSRKA